MTAADFLRALQSRAYGYEELLLANGGDIIRAAHQLAKWKLEAWHIRVTPVPTLKELYVCVREIAHNTTYTESVPPKGVVAQYAEHEGLDVL